MNVYSSCQKGDAPAVGFSPGAPAGFKLYHYLYAVTTAPDIVNAFIDTDTVYVQLDNGAIYSKPTAIMWQDVPKNIPAEDALEWLLYRKIVSQDIANSLFKNLGGFKAYKGPKPAYKWRIINGKLETQT